MLFVGMFLNSGYFCLLFVTRSQGSEGEHLPGEGGGAHWSALDARRPPPSPSRFSALALPFSPALSLLQATAIRNSFTIFLISYKQQWRFLQISKYE